MVNQESIVRIDHITFTSIKLKLNNFSGPFITHGIDIFNDPADPDFLWMYAVNHLPNPERFGADPPIS